MDFVTLLTTVKVIVMRRRIFPDLLCALILSAGVAFSESVAPMGKPGASAAYRIDAPSPIAGSVVETLTISPGPLDAWQDTPGQWLHLRAVKGNGKTFEVWLLCAAYPPAAIKEARGEVLRYLLQQGDQASREFRHAATGWAVLPGNGGWAHLLPRAAPGSGQDPLPSTVDYLGHRYLRETLDQGDPEGPPAEVRVVSLRPDVLLGVPHNTRQADETRRYDDSEYDYIPLERSDFEAMFAAGINCFHADAENVAWLENAGVFYWGIGGGSVPYPECLYQPQYLGPALFLDEPAVVTRDSMIRPRLREDPEFRQSITPQDALAMFEEHYAEVIGHGAPTQFLAGLAARDDVDLGDMAFAQGGLYSWETMVSSAAHQLLYKPDAPDAIVFEPPGQLGLRRTVPDFNLSYGCEIPITGTDSFVDIIIGFLRGAARASGKEWGISIYGGVDPVEAPAFFSRAYELGATRFFFWDSARLACVPFGEVLSLSRHVTGHANSYPYRDLEGLRNAAEVAILLPPGYNLGHVHMGKGLLWGVDELNLERKNREGIPYRTVMGNFFTEIERCLRLGVAFDLMWDLSGLKLEGYREVVRVLESGKVEVIAGMATTMLDGPRIPVRPEGQDPRLSVTLRDSGRGAPRTLTAEAHVIEGDAPVYFAPAPDAQGVHHNVRVSWELYGPTDADYTYRAPGIVRGTVEPHPEGGHTATAIIRIAAPGHYRLRAATTDLAGRSTVVWITIDAELH